MESYNTAKKDSNTLLIPKTEKIAMPFNTNGCKLEKFETFGAYTAFIHEGIKSNDFEWSDYLRYDKSLSVNRHETNFNDLVHDGKKVKCPKCDKILSDSGTLKRHISSIHDGKRVICLKCGKNFSFRESLKRHTDAVHEGKKAKCPKCNKILSDKGVLNRHIKVVHKDNLTYLITGEAVLTGDDGNFIKIR